MHGLVRLKNLPRKHWLWRALVAAALAVMVVRIISTYAVFNDTADEPYHIGAAVSYCVAKHHVRGTQHPPLTRIVAGVPLVLAGIDSARDRGVKTVQNDLTAFEIGHDVLLRSHRPYWTVLTIARTAMIVFPIAAVVYVYLLGRYLAGPLVGTLSAVCFSTDPTLLGHGAVVATDVAAAAGFLAALYHGTRLLARSTWRRALLAGVVIGLAVACKFSCLAVIPALALILLTRRLGALRCGRPRAYVRAWPRAVHLLAVALVAFVTLWATYLFDVGRPGDSTALRPLAEWNVMPEWLKPVPLPMPAAFWGFAMVWEHNRAGHSTYFNGTVSNTASWGYFPEAIALKTPTAVVIGLALALATGLMARRTPRALVTLIAFAVYLAASINSGINIGIRHVLPAIPLLYIVMIQQLARVRMTAAVVGIALLAIVETLWLHPDYLAFFNVLAGGPTNGGKYLLDSNLDWGQDQARLKDWLEQHARGRVVTNRVFGNPRLRQWPHQGFELLPPGSSPRGLLAVSKNEAAGLYLGVFEDEQGKRWVEAPLQGLSRMRPVARVGYSIDIYDLDAPSGRR
jgi:hypothetical protein